MISKKMCLLCAIIGRAEPGPEKSGQCRSLAQRHIKKSNTILPMSEIVSTFYSIYIALNRIKITQFMIFFKCSKVCNLENVV